MTTKFLLVWSLHVSYHLAVSCLHIWTSSVTVDPQSTAHPTGLDPSAGTHDIFVELKWKKRLPATGSFPAGFSLPGRYQHGLSQAEAKQLSLCQKTDFGLLGWGSSSFEQALFSSRWHSVTGMFWSEERCFPPPGETCWWAACLCMNHRTFAGAQRMSPAMSGWSL